jgi:hypothetical protein
MDQLKALIDPTGACADPARICAVASLFKLSLATPADIQAGLALAAQLISADVTSVEHLAAVQAVTGASLFVHKEAGAVTGVLGFFSARQSGLQALEAGGFDARDFDLDLVARPGEAPAAVYAFGVAASTKQAGSYVIRGSAGIQEALFWGVPIFTRVATEDGARVLLGSLGFARMANDPSLVRRPPRRRALEGFRDGAMAP